MKVLIIGLCKAAIIECRETIVKGLIDVNNSQAQTPSNGSFVNK